MNRVNGYVCDCEWGFGITYTTKGISQMWSKCDRLQQMIDAIREIGQHCILQIGAKKSVCHWQ